MLITTVDGGRGEGCDYTRFGGLGCDCLGYGFGCLGGAVGAVGAGACSRELAGAFAESLLASSPFQTISQVLRYVKLFTIVR
jgi:hypothetical protein